MTDYISRQAVLDLLSGYVKPLEGDAHIADIYRNSIECLMSAELTAAVQALPAKECTE